MEVEGNHWHTPEQLLSKQPPSESCFIFLLQNWSSLLKPSMALMPSEAFKFQGFAEPIMAKTRCPPPLAQPKNHVAEDTWKDNRKSKMNPAAPDFKHKVTEESQWIDGCYNPRWIKDRLQLEKTEQSSVEMHEAKVKGEGEEYVAKIPGSWEVLSSVEEKLTSLEQGMLPPPPLENCAWLLHKCKKERNQVYALRLHSYLHKIGLEAHRSLGNSLVSMLVEVGRMHDAQQVFDKLVYRNDCSWNSLIIGYIKHGKLRRALSVYQTMPQDDSLHLSEYAFVALLKACTQLKDLERGCKIHADIAKKGMLETNIFIGSTLVHMYAKCGLLAKAQEVFDKLPVPNAVSWNALITGYVEHRRVEEALYCFEQMQLEGVSPDAVTFVSSLKACGSIGATDKGREIHAMIARKGLERNLFVGNTLVDMYANFGLLAKAQDVFDKLLDRDTVSWNALIAGYAKHGHGEEALSCFKQMRLEGIPPNAITFVCTLKACSSIGATDEGGEIHAEIARMGLEKDLFVGSTLIDMYAKCGLLTKAQEVFDELPVRDTVSWNALILGYVEHGHGQEALNCFEQMQLEGFPSDAVTLACSLKACGSIGAIDKGREIHAVIARRGLERDLVVGSTLVDMYAKCGLLAKAQELFDKLPVRNTVSWSALVAGYAEHGRGEEALNCFQQMQLEGVSPNAVTYVCSLKACGSIGATDKGREIHAQIARKGLERDLVVGSTLVDMYAKCGLLAKAQEVFDKLPVRNIVSWNALITGYAQIGESENVFHIFDRMIGDGEKPNLVTFLSVLNACGHAGLVDKAQTYFESMSRDYGIIPTLEHHTCMVDLLGRAGQLGKAVTMIEKMPCDPDVAVWLTLLGACRKWGNVELGRHAFERAVQLDGKDATAYVCMCNIYANAGMQEDANEVEAMRVGKQAWKKLRCSWFPDVGGTVLSFLVGDKVHYQNAKLEDSPPQNEGGRLCPRYAMGVIGHFQ